MAEEKFFELVTVDNQTRTKGIPLEAYWLNLGEDQWVAIIKTDYGFNVVEPWSQEHSVKEVPKKSKSYFGGTVQSDAILLKTMVISGQIKPADLISICSLSTHDKQVCDMTFNDLLKQYPGVKEQFPNVSPLLVYLSVPLIGKVDPKTIDINKAIERGDLPLINLAWLTKKGSFIDFFAFTNDFIKNAVEVINWYDNVIEKVNEKAFNDFINANFSERKQYKHVSKDLIKWGLNREPQLMPDLPRANILYMYANNDDDIKYVQILLNSGKDLMPSEYTIKYLIETDNYQMLDIFYNLDKSIVTQSFDLNIQKIRKDIEDIKLYIDKLLDRYGKNNSEKRDLKEKVFNILRNESQGEQRLELVYRDLADNIRVLQPAFRDFYLLEKRLDKFIRRKEDPNSNILPSINEFTTTAGVGPVLVNKYKEFMNSRGYYINPDY